MATIVGEIYILPFFGQGHLLPSIELCKRLSSSPNYKTILIISSDLSSSVPSSLRHHPLVEIAQLTDDDDHAPPPDASSAGQNPFHHREQNMGQSIESFLSARVNDPTRRPLCAVIDIMMSWSKEFFVKFGIPTAAFFTSGACSAAMELGSSKAQVGDMKPGEIQILPGLPEDMAVTYSDSISDRRPPHPPHAGPGGPPPGLPGPPGGQEFGFPGNIPDEHVGRNGPPPGLLGPPGGYVGRDGPPPGLRGPPGGQKFGPPMAGNNGPPWVDEVDGSIAMLINTCDDLERSFTEYLAKQVGKPVWGVGPLLPEQYWKSAITGGSILHDREVRSTTRKSNYSEDDVVEWLDSKPRGSVIYVAFGSEVGPSAEEYAQLADALEETSNKWGFIWVIQPNAGGRHGGPPPPPRKGLGGPGPDDDDAGGEETSHSSSSSYDPQDLDEKVGGRGLIIRGWAPQLMILSHPSTGGFLSHCGWNSTVEAIGLGVPILAWPIRGDQFSDAKLVVNHLKVGHRVVVSNGDHDCSEDSEIMVKKEDIVKGIERLMSDEESVHNRAAALAQKFNQGNFPASSEAALDAFRDFITQK